MRICTIPACCIRRGAKAHAAAAHRGHEHGTREALPLRGGQRLTTPGGPKPAARLTPFPRRERMWLASGRMPGWATASAWISAGPSPTSPSSTTGPAKCGRRKSSPGRTSRARRCWRAPARGAVRHRCLARSRYFTHGTTVGINTVIQRKGLRLALFTTEHFRDVLEIARLQDPGHVQPAVQAAGAADHPRPGVRHRRPAAGRRSGEAGAG